MKQTAFTLTDSGHLEPCHVDEAYRDHEVGTSRYWIHVEDTQPEELQAWLDGLDLSAFARSRLAEMGSTTQVFASGSSVFLAMRVLPSTESTHVHMIGALSLKNLLVTIDLDSGVNHESVVTAVLESELSAPTQFGVLCAVLEVQSSRTATALRRLRTEIFSLDEKMENDPETVELAELVEARDRLLKILAVTEEQLECVEALPEAANVARSIDGSNLHGTLGLIRSALSSTERMSLRLEKRVDDLRQRYSAAQQDRLNRRLAVLTVISAIFLPLTLVAGIWGMNFENMPELRFTYAYPAALGLMAVLMGGLLWFFRRNGWFD